MYFSPIGILGQSAELAVKEVKAAGKPVRLISKTGTKIGWLGEGAAIGIDLYNLMNNPSPGNYAQLQTTIGIAGLNFTGVGAAGSFAASLVDNAGAFNWYYNGLDKIHDKTGLIILPPGLYPFPIIIPSFKNR